MATIQVRDVPEDEYEVIRRRARAAGQSIQAYMLDRVREMAARPTEDELFERMERLARNRRVDPAVLRADLDAGRR